MRDVIREMAGTISDEAVDRQRDATRKRLAARDGSRRFRHRAYAGLALAGVVAVVTAGAIVLAPPPLPSMTDEARMALYNADLDRQWVLVSSLYPDIARPDVDLVEFMDSIEEQTAQVSECLEAEGVPNIINSDGTGITWGSSVDPTLPFYVCQARYPLDPALSQPLSDEEIDYIRDFYIQVVTPCAASYGYRVTPPPTAEEFRQIIRSGDYTRYWFPVANLSDVEMEQLAGRCSVVPPLRFNAE